MFLGVRLLPIRCKTIQPTQLLSKFTKALFHLLLVIFVPFFPFNLDRAKLVPIAEPLRQTSVFTGNILWMLMTLLLKRSEFHFEFASFFMLSQNILAYSCTYRGKKFSYCGSSLYGSILILCISGSLHESKCASRGSSCSFSVLSLLNRVGEAILGKTSLDG